MPNWKAPGARLLLLVALALALAAVAAAPQAPSADPHRAEVVLSRGEAPRWAIAIHGGAGVISRAKMADSGKAHVASLRAALEVGGSSLAAGGSSLDAVEKGVRYLADKPLFNAGKGAVYNHEGIHELDAAIMDGSRLACGAAAAVKTVKNPISLARLVMQRSPHVLLVGEGADRFVAAMGARTTSTPPTASRSGSASSAGGRARPNQTTGPWGQWRSTAKGTSPPPPRPAAPPTSCRVGWATAQSSAPYANNRTCAVSGTGAGEEFIRHTVAYDISALVEYRGATPQQAARQAEAG
jgi:beta-aspartyl-peptidase (threonine type)